MAPPGQLAAVRPRPPQADQRQLGHLAGDDVLRPLSSALNQNLPRDWQAYRLGGDEFAVLARCRRRALTSWAEAAAHLTRPSDAPISAEYRHLRAARPGAPSWRRGGLSRPPPLRRQTARSGAGHGRGRSPGPSSRRRTGCWSANTPAPMRPAFCSGAERPRRAGCAGPARRRAERLFGADRGGGAHARLPDAAPFGPRRAPVPAPGQLAPRRAGRPAAAARTEPSGFAARTQAAGADSRQPGHFDAGTAAWLARCSARPRRWCAPRPGSVRPAARRNDRSRAAERAGRRRAADRARPALTRQPDAGCGSARVAGPRRCAAGSAPCNSKRSCAASRSASCCAGRAASGKRASATSSARRCCGPARRCMAASMS